MPPLRQTVDWVARSGEPAVRPIGGCVEYGRSEAFVLKPGEGRSIDLGGFQMSVKATDESTSGAFSLLEADEPAGFGPPMHIHHDAAEAFYVLEGST